MMVAAELRRPRAGRIQDAEFRRFRDFFYRKTGIHFDDNKRYFVDKRLLDRIRATDSPSFRSWFTTMRFDPTGAEFQELVNAMTVNESYFCRESHQFDLLVDHALDHIASLRRPGPIRIWVVPSSTGEEPYSIALYLLERWPRIHELDVEIVASDIDTSVLARARQGLYSARSVQYVPEPWLHTYFTRSGDHWQLCDDLRGAVSFQQVNLVDPRQSRAFRRFDIVFCRNMLIYFDDDSRRTAVNALYDALRPGGLMFLGHSETLSRITPRFVPRRMSGSLVYERPQFEENHR